MSKQKLTLFSFKLDELNRQYLELLSNNPSDRYNLSKTLRRLITSAYNEYDKKITAK